MNKADNEAWGEEEEPAEERNCRLSTSKTIAICFGISLVIAILIIVSMTAGKDKGTPIKMQQEESSG
jgi:hypothetical protein